MSLTEFLRLLWPEVRDAVGISFALLAIMTLIYLIG